MSRDPLVAEVRAIREAYAKKFNYDLEAIFRDLKELERKGGRKVVSFPPKRVHTVDRKQPVIPKLG